MERLGRYRWGVELTLAWKKPLRHLRIRDEGRDELHFDVFACGLMPLRRHCPGIC
ncbi:hypothetical protein [Corallococcus sp. CA049B]|uniref:hypothetical protein n=1 Tax=Corallococcus sp. CA049B TaxID=2316730 RepID=UPI0013155FA5